MRVLICAGRYYAEWTVNAVWPDEKATAAN